MAPSEDPGNDERHLLLVVDEGAAGERLDRFLATRLPGFSRSSLQRLIRAGEVRRNGRTVRDSGRAIKLGDVLTIDIPAPQPSTLEPEAVELGVVYEDEHLIVIDKPKGMAVHPGPGHAAGTLVNALIAHCGRSLSGIGGVERPGIVHRLDKDTTGLLVVAKTDATHRGLSAQFAAHGTDGKLERGYRALVWGVPERRRGVIDAALVRSTSNRRKMTVSAPGRGRKAVTRYAVRESFSVGGRPAASLLALTLETGRTHQVRVHLAHIGHPLMGDTLYGAGFKASARRLGSASRAALEALARQALHAAVLAFEHPITGARLAFESPLPPDMARLAAALAQESHAPST
jgi:23S rRNA pseudouridine1911/1915/1917 synthase